jgi:hypothetical protein
MSTEGATPGGVASNPDGNPRTPDAAVVPETNGDDDTPPAPALLPGEDDGGGTLIQTSALPKRYSWYQPYENLESIYQIMVQTYGCTLEDDQRSKRNEAAQNIDWLCPELRGKVDAYQPVAGTDINDKGEIDETRLSQSLQQILGDTGVQAYCNIYQLRDLVQRFAARWGFHVKIRQCNIVCHFGKDDNRSEEYAKGVDAEKVTPSRKRKCN